MAMANLKSPCWLCNSGFYEWNLANPPRRLYLNHSYTYIIWLVTREWPISTHLANYKLDYIIHAQGWRFKPHLVLSPRLYTTPYFYVDFWTFHIQYVYIRHTYVCNVCVTCVCGQLLRVVGSRWRSRNLGVLPVGNPTLICMRIQNMAWYSKLSSSFICYAHFLQKVHQGRGGGTPQGVP
jgi:hypothetical protein